MSENMVRTQVYLPREMYDRLQKRAIRHELTLALQIRTALEDYLERQEALDEPILRADDPIFEMIGMFSSKEGDLSVNHDHYLYGAPKREIVEPEPVRVREKSEKYSAKRSSTTRKQKKS
jgi:hypothetical protein